VRVPRTHQQQQRRRKGEVRVLRGAAGTTQLCAAGRADHRARDLGAAGRALRTQQAWCAADSRRAWVPTATWRSARRVVTGRRSRSRSSQTRSRQDGVVPHVCGGGGGGLQRRRGHDMLRQLRPRARGRRVQQRRHVCQGVRCAVCGVWCAVCVCVSECVWRGWGGGGSWPGAAGGPHTAEAPAAARAGCARSRSRRRQHSARTPSRMRTRAQHAPGAQHNTHS
jgi:hypothetical protein